MTIDPGDPFLPGHDFASLVQRLQDSLLLGVEHEQTARFRVGPGVTVYPLPREITGVTLVSGLSRKVATTFTPGADYTVSLSRVVWQDAAPQLPDPGSPLDVTFRYREQPTGLTDVGPGSVAGTLLRAVGREMALLYQQVNEAYRRAFLDTASGVALDGVVALLGVTRNAATAASGTVRFSRRQGGSRVVVPASFVVEDRAHRRYVTTAPATLADGELSAEAAVQALEPGPSGNNAAGTLVVMPTPATGVDGVTNPDPIDGGQPAESDAELRERARHVLEGAGHATMSALEFAVRDVDGVEDVTVIDHSVDPGVQLGEVRVRYSAGGSEQRKEEIYDAVVKAVESTRPAGVLAVVEQVREVKIAGQLVVMPGEGGAAAAATQYAHAVDAAIGATGIGQALSQRRLLSLVYSTPGLADVLEARLTFTRELPAPHLPASGAVGDLLPVDHSERTISTGIAVVLVAGLRGSPPTAPAAPSDPVVITVEILAGGQPLTLADARVQFQVEVRTGLLTTPTLPPAVIATAVKEVTFSGSSTATLALTTDGAGGDLHGYRHGDHDPNTTATLTLVGFPGVPPATTALVLW